MPQLSHDILNVFIDSIMEGDESQFRRLLEQHPDLAASDLGQKGVTGLHHAAWLGHAPMAKLLIKNGASLESRNPSGFTPLHTAIENRKLEIAAVLLEAGANPNAYIGRDGVGMHTMHQAAIFPEGHAFMRVLVSHGALIEPQHGQCGETPIHMSAWRGHTANVSFLLNVGANPLRVVDGCTSLKVAEVTGQTEVAGLIRSWLDAKRALETIKTARKDLNPRPL